ncbi:MAG: ABC transporter permease [Planctomycetes bacterium]|nr:ABC transporter permease [Planctomycetota bacterium]
MNLAQTIIIGVRNLRLHKVRSTLTMLGMIFGVGAVIAMLSIGEGARWEILQQIKLLGTENITIRSVKPPKKTRRAEETEGERWVLRYGLRRKDVSHIEAVCPGIDLVIPMRDVRKDVWYADRRMDARVVGTTPLYASVLNLNIHQGRFFYDYDMTKNARVCVIGAEVAERLFGFKEPLGEYLKIGDQWYFVIGILENRASAKIGTQAMTAYDVNKDIYIPLTSAFSRFGTLSITSTAGAHEALDVELDEIIVHMKDTEFVEKNALLIKSILAKRHEDEDYEIVVPMELLRQKQKTQRTFNIVMISIAAISLLVGGIGIMNIMLANVTERTREIGIRRAVGARQSDIIKQFLTETVVLSGSGGLIGIIVGIIGAKIVDIFAGLTTIVSLYFPLVAFTISVAIGIIFGMYPARKAAFMDPIQALRYE